MPEFILDMGSAEGAATFNRLDAFTQGYIEAAFFTETGTGDDAERDLEHATIAELAPDALATIVADCAAWQAANAALLEEAYARGYTPEQAGQDLWYTSNGHGVGFWDRAALDAGSLGNRLSDACRGGESHLYRGDDGLVHIE